MQVWGWPQADAHLAHVGHTPLVVVPKGVSVSSDTNLGQRSDFKHVTNLGSFSPTRN